MNYLVVWVHFRFVITPDDKAELSDYYFTIELSLCFNENYSYSSE